MKMLRKYWLVFTLLGIIVLAFVIANQIRVANNGDFVSSVMLLRYFGYLLIAAFIFYVGVKIKYAVVYNLGMVFILIFFIEVLFYLILGMPTREYKSFGIPEEATEIYRSLGYMPEKDSVINDVYLNEGDTSFNVDYTIDEFHKRVTPKIQNYNEQYALFFGCSIVYGYGLNDNETIPYKYQENGNITSYNFGFNGHGTNHVLARLEHEDLSKQVKEKDGKAFYLFFWDHIPRAIGTMKRYTEWLHNAPYYYREADKVVRNKTFKEGKPITSFFYETIYHSSFLDYYNIDFPLSVNARHYELVALMIKEAKKKYIEQFGNKEFYMVLLPNNDTPKNDFDEFIEIVKQNEIEIIDLTDFVEYGPKYTLKGDPHPNAYFTSLFAKALYEKFK
jgi:hypothetical protein